MIHHQQTSDHARIGVFFATTTWKGELYNAEPDQCGKLVWCDPKVLPSNTIPYPAAGIAAYVEGRPFLAHGWSLQE